RERRANEFDGNAAAAPHDLRENSVKPAAGGKRHILKKCRPHSRINLRARIATNTVHSTNPKPASAIPTKAKSPCAAGSSRPKNPFRPNFSDFPTHPRLQGLIWSAYTLKKPNANETAQKAPITPTTVITERPSLTPQPKNPL